MNITSSKVVNILLIVLLSVSSTAFIYLSFFSDKKANPTSVSSDISVANKALMINPIIGDPFDLNEVTSKVIVVNFWATWCGPCLIELPALISLKNTYASDDLQIIGVSMDDSESTVKRFSQKNPFNYPITMQSYFIRKKFGNIAAIPTTFVLDENLNIIKKFQGYHQKSTLESVILSIL